MGFFFHVSENHVILFLYLCSDAVAWELAYIPWCCFLDVFSSSDYQQSLLTSITLFLKEEGSEASLPS